MRAGSTHPESRRWLMRPHLDPALLGGQRLSALHITQQGHLLQAVMLVLAAAFLGGMKDGDTTGLPALREQPPD